jgi:diguanylate cyclase (GGDEF)-like protein
MLLPARRLTRAGCLEQRLILAAVALLGVLLLIDMAVAHNLLPWHDIPLAWGVLAFALAIVIIAVRQYAATQRALARLNTSLEGQVAERTAELEQLVQREAARIHLLEIENRKTASLETLVAVMQHGGSLAASAAPLSAHLPALCAPLAGALFRAGPRAQPGVACATWGSDPPDLAESLVVPAADGRLRGALSGEVETKTTDTIWTAPIWPFRLHYEHPQLGDKDFGLLLVRAPVPVPVPVPVRGGEQMGEGGDQAEFTQETRLWWQVLHRVVEKINLTLSLLALQDELRVLSYEDGLTGLKNRRFLDEVLAREIAVAERQRESLSLLICDVDHFKRFNDTHGHAAGDAALVHVAKLLGQVCRDTDLVCRYGGEEFVVLMPSARMKSASERGEALRARVAVEPILFQGAALGPVTLSVGIACYPEGVVDPRDLMERADEALYQAKQTGRDRVVVIAGGKPTEPCPESAATLNTTPQPRPAGANVIAPA